MLVVTLTAGEVVTVLSVVKRFSLSTLLALVRPMDARTDISTWRIFLRSYKPWVSAIALFFRV